MNKGTMIVGIADGVAQIAKVSAEALIRSKETGVITDNERSYFVNKFNEWLKEGNQYIVKVQELLSPKHGSNDADKLKLLEQMYRTIKSYTVAAKKFEKGFSKLCTERSKRLTDTKEIERLFKGNGAKKEISKK